MIQNKAFFVTAQNICPRPKITNFIKLGETVLLMLDSVCVLSDMSCVALFRSHVVKVQKRLDFVKPFEVNTRFCPNRHGHRS